MNIKKESRICILHTNDTHSYLDQFAKRAYLVKKIQMENKEKGIDTFLVDSGDVLTGNIYFMLYQGKKEAQLMNLLGYDAMTLGNHEFDLGSSFLSNFLDQIQFPIVSANVDIKEDPYLKKHVDPSNPKVVPYLIKTLNNQQKIAFVGLTTLETYDSASPGVGTIITDPIEKTKQIIDEIKALGINTIIVLSHLGVKEDQRLAQQVDGIDAIIGGHSHTLLQESITIEKNNKKTIIVQVGAYNQYIGQLTLCLDQQGNVKESHEKVIEIKQEDNEDAVFKPIVAQMKEKKRQFSSKVIGEAANYLNGERPQLKLRETNLGNLVADAFFYKAKELGYQPDLAIMNGMGIRNSLEKGPIYFTDIYKVLPFSKSLMILEVMGKDIVEALENGAYPQVSFLKVEFMIDNQNQKKITKILILNQGKYEPLQTQRKYIVATNSFVGIGKDNYIGFTNATIICEDACLDVHVLSDYLSSLPQPIVYKEEGRVKYNKQ